MRSRIQLFLILLHCAAATGHAAETVVVEAPLIRVVPAADIMRARCVIEGNFDACTNFIGFRLDATCGPEGTVWRVDASARFRPWIILLNIRQLSHEQEHIADVRDAVARYVTGLQRLDFDSQEQCSQFAMQARDAFPTRMREFARDSNARMHASLR